MDHKTVTSERGTTHYWVRQNADMHAPVLVFTHGLCADHSMFEKQIEFFSDRYTILTWDVPLHGLSRPCRDFTYDHTAEDLAAILDAEGFGEVILVGMSMGGYPSQAFTDLCPEKVQAFVGIDTTPFGKKYYSKSDYWWLQRVGAMMRLMPDKTLRKSIADGNGLTEYSRDLMFSMLKPFSKAEICEQVDAGYKTFTKENRDVEISFPILILVGEKDTTGKVKQYCKAWADDLGTDLVVIPQAAHMSNTDNPEKVNLEIERFLSALDL